MFISICGTPAERFEISHNQFSQIFTGYIFLNAELPEFRSLFEGRLTKHCSMINYEFKQPLYLYAMSFSYGFRHVLLCIKMIPGLSNTFFLSELRIFVTFTSFKSVGKCQEH